MKTKIQMCREQWQMLAPHVKDRPTAKYLIAAVEIAEALLRENNRLEMENRQLRSTVDDYETQWVENGGALPSLGAAYGSGSPVFATEEEAQKFRDDYSTEMEPILKEQRKARALSELDARYPMRRELKRCAAALQLLEQRYGCGSARLVIDGETATISQILDEADRCLGSILPNAELTCEGTSKPETKENQ